jgi:hypothetical protein
VDYLEDNYHATLAQKRLPKASEAA